MVYYAVTSPLTLRVHSAWKLDGSKMDAARQQTMRVVYLLVILSLSVSGDVDKIKIEPAGNIIIPRMSSVELRCVQREAGISLGWRVYFSSGGFQYITSSMMNNLDTIGINVVYPNATTSILRYNATSDSVVAVDCRYFEHTTGSLVGSENTSITIVDSPPRPCDVNISLERNLLRVAWYFPSSPSGTETFSVVLQMTEGMQRANVMDNQSYVFSFNITEQCQDFQVEIIVSNIAGSNKTSVNGTIPSLPEEICHEISAKNKEIKLTATFMAPQCVHGEINATFQMQVFELYIGNKNNNSLDAHCAQELTGLYVCQTESLSKNRKYNFSIIVSNTVGSVMTDLVTISTSGIQEVGLLQLDTTDMYSIMCSFLPGIDIQGCHFMLIGGDNVSNISGVINRQNIDIVVAKVLHIPKIEHYTEILAYEIRSSNMTINNFNAVINPNIFDFLQPQECLIHSGTTKKDEIPTEHLMRPTNNKKIRIIVGAAIGGFSALLLILVVFIFSLCCFGCKFSISSKQSKFMVEEGAPPPEPIYNKLEFNDRKTNSDGKTSLEPNDIYSKIHPIEVPVYHVLESEKPRDVNIYEDVGSRKTSKWQHTTV